MSEINTIADSLGRGIDEGIKEDVVSFRACGLETIGSCEGHADQEEGYHPPYIDIGIEPPSDFFDRLKQADYRKDRLAERDQEDYEKFVSANEAQKERVLELLDEFYEHREVPRNRRLSLRPFDHFSYQRIGLGLNKDSFYTENSDEIARDLDSCQEEMHAFRDFLKDKFFSLKEDRERGDR